LDLELDNIARAAGTIDPVFVNSPQFVAEGASEALGREILVEVETMNPIADHRC
jgi:threonine dehydratase